MIIDFCLKFIGINILILDIRVSFNMEIFLVYRIYVKILIVWVIFEIILKIMLYIGLLCKF